TLTVSDGKGGTSSKALRIDAGETPPAARITSPAASKLFRVGETITLQGSASDAQDGTLPDGSLSWRVILHHATHTHPFLPPTTGNNISFTAPAPEDLLAATNSYLEIELTATDSRGLTSVVTQALNPHKVGVTFLTEPTGLRVEVNGTSVTGPQSVTSWEAYRLDVNAPSQTDSTGASWIFSSWSDGGSAAHAITTPASASSYTATFQRATTSATFAPDADARVQEANPTTNYGASAYLRADAGADPDVESYLRFTVSGLNGGVTRATLRLFEYNGTVDGPAVYATGTSWSESGITWSNRPARTSAAVSDKGSIAANSWVDYDVTSLVSGNGTYSFNLATTSSDASYVYSRENATNRPELVVVPETATTVEIAPAADARVEEVSPSSNFGTSGYLAADGGADPDKEMYLRFGVSGVSGAITSAKLRLYVYNGSADGPAVYSTGNSWSETGITWSNRPARTSGATDDKRALAAGTWVEYDVKAFITGDGTYSFVLATTSADALYVYSRDHTDPALRPRLVITAGGG
ncbi:MAG: DNRLRE domain-containing protein, partial [Chloroflexota bacterium]|nr:DNRLRE domain-containing protein [Chloroflexota bacterium]